MANNFSAEVMVINSGDLYFQHKIYQSSTFSLAAPLLVLIFIHQPESQESKGRNKATDFKWNYFRIFFFPFSEKADILVKLLFVLMWKADNVLWLRE